MNDLMDNRHSGKRNVLRVIGPLIAVVGLILIIIGFVSFFTAFGGYGPPRFFWCAFVGMPVLFVGIVLSSFGFMGSISRYQMNQMAPVAKDTVNYMAENTRDAVKDIASAVAEGIRGDAENEVIWCPACNEMNEADANFCGKCGKDLRS